MDGQWQKVREIFDSAIRRKPEERSQFVIKACGDDKTMRREVESLLSSLKGADEFLETPAAQISDFIKPVADVPTLSGGTQIGHYEILEQIGAGGMGEVYLAKDEKLDRRVAVKVLNERFSRDESNLRRFVQEAKAASALNHPNILTIYEFGAEGDEHYIVSEFIEGRTLREICREKSLKLSEVSDIAVQIAGALAAAHEAHLVHRDIKPENVMIRPDGYVKILDFGLAKLVERKNESIIGLENSTVQQNETAKGVILGTVNYMSPEQAKGEPVDERTDIFSFGVLLYEMIAGRTPFANESVSETLADLINKEPPPLVRFSPNIPNKLQRIVAKTLRKNKDERYQTMRDVFGDLKDLRENLAFDEKLERSAAPNNNATAIMQAMTGGAKRQTAATQNSFSQKIKRHKLITVLALAALLGALGLVAAGAWLIRHRQQSFAYIGVQKVAQITNWSGLDDFPSLSPDGKTVAYCSDKSGSFEIYIKQIASGAKELQLTNDGGQNFQPAFSPDGQRIAYYSKQRGGIWTIPASGGEARQIIDFGSHPAWSPDGAQIAFQSNGLNDLGAFARNALPPSTLWSVAASGGEPKQLTQIGNPAGGHGAPSFSPDGKRIVFEVDDYHRATIWTIAADGSDATEISPANEVSQIARGGFYEPVYAPDGKSIFYSADGIYQIHLNTDTNEPVDAPAQIAGIGGISSAVRHVSVSADGKRIAYSTLTRRESISSARLENDSGAPSAATPAPLFQNTNQRNNYPVFAPDGTRIAFATCNIGGTECDIWLMNADGGNQTQLTTNESTELMPNWFPDAKQIGFVSNRTGHFTLWAINLDTRREKMLLDLADDLDYARLSPDGSRIAFNSKKNGGVINVWTASPSGGDPKQLTFDKELMGFPTWSPDGKTIAFQMKRGDDTHIMVMPSEGGTPEQLTFDKGQSWSYGWSPDGDKILFAGQRDGFWNVRWVSRSTKKQQQVTDYKKLNSFVRYTSWSPLGNQVVYEYSETTGNIWIADLK